MSAAGRRAVTHTARNTPMYLRRENVTFIEPHMWPPNSPDLESSRLRCLDCPSTDGLSTSTIQGNQPAEAGNRHALTSCHAGLPASMLALFQRVLHAAARTVLDLKPRDCMTPALRELHWLSVAEKIQYKLCLLVHKSLLGHTPEYI